MICYRYHIACLLMIVMCLSMVSFSSVAATSKRAGTNIKGHGDQVSAVCFTPDGRILISGSFDGTAKVWNASTGAWIRDITKHQAKISKVTIDSTGKIVALAYASGDIELRNLVTAKIVCAFVSGVRYPEQLEFVSIESILISSSLYDRAELFSTVTGKCLKKMEGRSLVVGADLKTTAMSSGKGSVTLVNQITGKQTSLPAADRPNFFSSDGTMLVTATNEANGDEANPTDIIKVWNVATGKLLMQAGCINGALTFDRQGTRILVVNGLALPIVNMINIENGKCTMAVNSRQYFASAGTFSNDGKKIAIGGSDGGIIIWDILKNKQICNIKGSIPSEYTGL